MGSDVGVQTPVYHRGSDPEMVFSARTRARMGPDVGVQTPLPPHWVPVLGPCASPYMSPLGTHDILPFHGLQCSRWLVSRSSVDPRRFVGCLVIWHFLSPVSCGCVCSCIRNPWIMNDDA